LATCGPSFVHVVCSFASCRWRRAFSSPPTKAARPTSGGRSQCKRPWLLARAHSDQKQADKLLVIKPDSSIYCRQRNFCQRWLRQCASAQLMRVGRRNGKDLKCANWPCQTWCQIATYPKKMPLMSIVIPARPGKTTKPGAAITLTSFHTPPWGAAKRRNCLPERSITQYSGTPCLA
jgi:hypothetical protein